MINKQSLWFITLFSLILILGIYYVALPSTDVSVFSDNANNASAVDVKESDVIVALKVEEEEKILSQMEDAQNVLLNESASINEKNEAYETLQNLNSQKGKVSDIEKKIKKEFNVDSCVNIDSNKIKITLASKDQGKKYANKIIKFVQSMYTTPMYITVKFQ